MKEKVRLITKPGLLVCSSQSSKTVSMIHLGLLEWTGCLRRKVNLILPGLEQFLHEFKNKPDRVEKCLRAFCLVDIKAWVFLNNLYFGSFF